MQTCEVFQRGSVHAYLATVRAGQQRVVQCCYGVVCGVVQSAQLVGDSVAAPQAGVPLVPLVCHTRLGVFTHSTKPGVLAACQTL